MSTRRRPCRTSVFLALVSLPATTGCSAGEDPTARSGAGSVAAETTATPEAATTLPPTTLPPTTLPPGVASKTQATSAPPPDASPVAVVRALCESYARSPTTFALGDRVSRFYAQQGRKNDDACRSGGACVVDRFSCLDPPPSSPGRVEAAQADGEQPGVSASVRVRMTFGAQVVAPMVDVVFEDGGWRVDQVRCPDAAP